MSASPVRVHIRIEDISTQLFSTGTAYANQAKTIYLWSVFFKVDGTTVQVNSSLSLQGTATVVGTPGNQGDLPGGVSAVYSAVERTPIPPALGDYVTTLAPIPVAGTSFTGGGVMGYALILIFQNGTPASAVADGHQALNGAIQQGLDGVIPTLGIQNESITQADVSNITNQVAGAVTNAIKNGLSVWDKLGTVLDDEFQDSLIGNAFQYFTYGQLTASPPQLVKIPLNASITVSPPGYNGSPLYVFTFEGTVVADQSPYSLRQVMAFLGDAPTAGVRAAMGSSFNSSVVAWINKAL
ncbi:MAG: hypothetical protein ABSF83_07460 [Nitrososphaerales archaeon]|jgi:hypothetical protein